ncbi:hypothetical protein DB48_13855 [Shewanella sp. cp20]|nr:hypothetical protein DB48_13855 [Shewanella sp. cp20]
MRLNVNPLLLLAGLLWLGALPPIATDAWALKTDKYELNPYVGLGWGYRPGWHRDFYDPWRWQVGIGTGFPYWRHGYWRNDWGYWRDDWRYPYRYQPRKRREPKPIAPPQRVTTSLAQSDAIHSLPANARVKVKDGRTVYEWQGVEYVYDWNSDSYRIVK